LNDRVFVTGADGMLGASICREILKQNYAVKAFLLPDRDSNVLDGLDLELGYGNILDQKSLEAEMEGCEYVIHTAAISAVWPRRSEKTRQVIFDGTRNVMEIADKLGIRRMIHIGTANSFSPGPKEDPGTEESEFDGWKFGVDYIISKYLTQQMLLDRYEWQNFPVIIINPTFMIGPYDSEPTSGKMLVELISGKLFAYSGGGRNFVCSVDVAVAAVNALKQGRLGQCYVAGHENLEYGEFFKKACNACEKEFNMIKVPGFLVLCFGLINSVLARITGKPPQLSYSMARLSRISHYFSSAKAIRELNMPQTPIEQGIKSSVSWFRSNGYLK